MFVNVDATVARFRYNLWRSFRPFAANVCRPSDSVPVNRKASCCIVQQCITQTQPGVRRWQLFIALRHRSTTLPSANSCWIIQSNLRAPVRRTLSTPVSHLYSMCFCYEHDARLFICLSVCLSVTVVDCDRLAETNCENLHMTG